MFKIQEAIVMEQRDNLFRDNPQSWNKSQCFVCWVLKNKAPNATSYCTITSLIKAFLIPRYFASSYLSCSCHCINVFIAASVGCLASASSQFVPHSHC